MHVTMLGRELHDVAHHLNDINADNNHEFDPRTVTHGLNEEINNPFTSDEIVKQIKKKKIGNPQVVIIL